MAHRYAIYAAPPSDSALWRFGCAWLGRDPEGGPLPALPQQLNTPSPEVVATPARYGFHGTLKPPFRLHKGSTPEGLFQAVDTLAADCAPVEVEKFEVRSIGSFIAILPAPSPVSLPVLASRCVMELDSFRRSPTTEELARRRLVGLTARQEEMLSHWGYPYVLDEFRFHLTLTGKLDDRLRAETLGRLSTAAQASGALGPVAFKDLAIYAEDNPGNGFRLIRRTPLTG